MSEVFEKKVMVEMSESSARRSEWAENNSDVIDQIILLRGCKITIYQDERGVIDSRTVSFSAKAKNLIELAKNVIMKK